MALHGKKTLRTIQVGIDNRTDFNTGNVRGEWYDSWADVPKGRMPEPQKHMNGSGMTFMPVFVVFSYGTPIAWIFSCDTDPEQNGGPRWIIPDDRYSPTTSCHQGVIRTATRNPGFYPIGA